MMNKVTKDRIFAMATALLALYLGMESFAYPDDSSFFPRVLAVLLGGLSVFLFARLSLKRSKAIDSGVEGSSNGNSLKAELAPLKSAGLVFGSIIAYSLMLQLVNYEVATVLFLAVMMLLLGFRKPVWIIGICGGLTLLLYTIFFNLLGVSRPDSILFY